MGDIFLDFLNISITASWLILAILLFRLIFRKTPKWVICLLWGMVAIRLVCPFSVESVFSVVPSTEFVKTTTIVSGGLQNYIPSIDSSLPIVENTINPMLSESFAYDLSDSVAPVQVVTYVAGIIWICGIVVLLLYAVISRIRILLLIREAICLKGNVYECDGVSAPFILGVIKPKIYLPSGVDENNREYIIAHEKAHLARKDYWWKPFGFLLYTVYWFNPICLVAYILLCRDIEIACDEKVIKNLVFEEKKAYSRVLVACGQQRKIVMACPLAFGEVGVKERVKTVLNYKKPAFWLVVTAVAVSLLIAVCFLTNPPGEHPGKEMIPAGNSDEEIGSGGNAVTLSQGDALNVESGFLSEEETQRYELGDLDGNGEGEYLMISHKNELPGYEGHLCFYFNGESIYEYNDILPIAPINALYVDLDEDEKQEIFLRFYPYVNSAPLMEYIVLKQTGDAWTALEMPHGETMLDNAFPIAVSYGSKKNTIVISCEGTEKQITYDVEPHYQAMIDSYDEFDVIELKWLNDVLNGIDIEGNLFAEGDEFGGVADWGIWNIERGFYKDKNCLIATHGILGPCGKWDLLGELDIYFNYDKEGKVNILNMDFRSADAAILHDTQNSVGETATHQGNEIGMEGIDSSAENMGKVYTVNEDGTYTCEGKNYDYKIAVTGRDGTAVCDTRYIVLTDDKNITYEDIWWSMFGSNVNGVFSYTVILGVEALPEE